MVYCCPPYNVQYAKNFVNKTMNDNGITITHQRDTIDDRIQYVINDNYAYFCAIIAVTVAYIFIFKATQDPCN